MENTINESDNLIASPLSLEQAKIISRLIMSLNSISLCATIIGISTFLYIRFKYPRLADRVTFRIAFAGIVSEALFSIVQIVLNTQLNPTPLCGFIVWAWVFFSLTSVFFPTCIAINLHATFIHEYNGKRNLEKYYFIGSLTLATILSLIPLADKMYDWDEPENFCFFRDSGTRTNIIWQWSVLYGWQILCALYCAIIFVTVLIKLHRVSYQLVDTSMDGKTVTSHYGKNILKRRAIMISVIKRISWYPLVPLISQGPNFLYETNIYVAREVNYVMALLTVIIATEGLFNTIVFMQDIAVTRAYRLTKLRWWTNYVNKYEELYPHLSRNKSLISDPLTNSTANVKTEKEEQPKEQQQQPSFAEKLRYNILTLLIKKPKESDTNLSHDPYYVGDYEEESRIKSSVNIGGSDVDVEKYNENEEFNNEIISKIDCIRRRVLFTDYSPIINDW